MTLPITIPLWPDESVDSWIETLAHLNACAPRHIVTQASLNNGGNASPLTRSLRVETAQLLEVATGVDHTKIMNATLNRYQEVGLRPVAGQRIAEGTWATYPGTKYCPQCLTERQLRWKLSWHLSWKNVCLTHRCLLLDRCPACREIPRDSARPHPRSSADAFGSARSIQCPLACRTDILASATPEGLPASSSLLATARTLTTVLATGETALPYTDGLPIAARHFFSDLTLLTRAALAAIKAGDIEARHVEEAGLSAQSLTPQVGDAFDPSQRSQRLRPKVSDQPTPAAMSLATALAIDVLCDPRAREADLYPRDGHWLTPQRLKTVVDKIRVPRSSLHSRYLERLVGGPKRTKPKGGSTISTPRGHRKAAHSVYALTKARAQSIDAVILPSRLWPEAIRCAPTMPARVARTFPYLAPIALAAIGRNPDLENLATQFGIENDGPAIRTALNHLVSNEVGTDTVGYLATLHDHLRAFPPPIDYRRRRRLYPTPESLGRDASGLGSTRLRRLARAGGHYKTDAFTWKINRYVWQLLTGYDPFVTQAAQLRYGPAAYDYRRFVQRMHPDLQQAAGEVAEQLLLRHRIGEPVAYDLAWDLDSDTWSISGEPTHFLQDTGRTDLRRSSLSIQIAASTAGDPEELIHLALAGEHHLALRIYRFVLTHNLPAKEARLALGLSTGQISRETRRIEDALGEELFIPRSGRPRQLTPAGRELAAIARPYLADLQRVAGPDALPPDLSLLDPPPVKRR